MVFKQNLGKFTSWFNIIKTIPDKFAKWLKNTDFKYLLNKSIENVTLKTPESAQFTKIMLGSVAYALLLFLVGLSIVLVAVIFNIGKI